MFSLPPLGARYTRDQITRSVALALVASPAASVAYLFVASPESLGSPLAKLALMLGAGCLTMVAGDLSRALARWAQVRWEAFGMTAAPESRHLG